MSFFDFFHGLVHFVEKNHLRDYFSDRTFLEGWSELWKESKGAIFPHPNHNTTHSITNNNINNNINNKNGNRRRFSVVSAIILRIIVFAIKLPYTLAVTIPYTIIHLGFSFVLAGTRGAAAFNRVMRYIIALTFGIHVLFELLKYIHPKVWVYECHSFVI